MSTKVWRTSESVTTAYFSIVSSFILIQQNSSAATRFRDSFCVFFAYKKLLGRTEMRTRGWKDDRRYEQFETSPDTIEQELRPVDSEQQQTDNLAITI